MIQGTTLGAGRTVEERTVALTDDSDYDIPDERATKPLSDSEAFWAILAWSAIGLVLVALYAAFAPPMYR
jgi:hypothetical protein